MSPAEFAIARTVIYASLFDYPLTLDQLHRSLVECDLTADEILSVFSCSDVLPHLIEHRDGLFFPAGRGELVAERRRREARSRRFLARHRFVLRLICAIPFTRLVALSGSVAHLNLEPDGDLDLFIVTRGPRVWTVTLAVLLLTKLMGRRRVICTNFILSDAHLKLDQQDLFTANQVIHLEPLIGESTLETFVAANPFVARFYPNAIAKRSSVAQAFTPDGAATGIKPIKRLLETILELPSPAIEACCRRLYSWHLRRRAVSWRSPDQVRLQTDYLKLHTQSHRHAILCRFDRLVQDALLTAERVVVPVRRRSAAR
jgi:hypothetical protein